MNKSSMIKAFVTYVYILQFKLSSEMWYACGICFVLCEIVLNKIKLQDEPWYGKLFYSSYIVLFL